MFEVNTTVDVADVTMYESNITVCILFSKSSYSYSVVWYADCSESVNGKVVAKVVFEVITEVSVEVDNGTVSVSDD